MTRKLFIILFLLALLPIATATAQDGTDPQATAQAAERRARLIHAATRAARAEDERGEGEGEEKCATNGSS